MLYRGTPLFYPNLTAGCYRADEGTGHTAVKRQDLAWAFNSCRAEAGLVFGIRCVNGPVTTCIPARELLEGSGRRAAGEHAVQRLQLQGLRPPCRTRSLVRAEGHWPTLPARGLRWARCHLRCPAAGDSAAWQRWQCGWQPHQASPAALGYLPRRQQKQCPSPRSCTGDGRWAGVFWGREYSCLRSHFKSNWNKLKKLERQGGGKDKIR